MNAYWEEAKTGIRVSEFSIGKIVELLDEGMPFSFSRWGDGEWAAVLGDDGRNCDGHKYFPEMGARLRDILFGIDFATGKEQIYRDPYNFKGILPCAHKAHGDRLKDFLWKNNLSIPWLDGMSVMEANRDGKLAPLVKAMRNKKVAYVGNFSIEKTVKDFFGADVFFIRIPMLDCYLQKETTKAWICRAILENEVNFVGFSAGMTANILIEEMWQISGKLDLTLFDFGSIFDPYVGKISRAYMRELDWKDLKKRNLPK